MPWPPAPTLPVGACRAATAIMHGRASGRGKLRCLSCMHAVSAESAAAVSCCAPCCMPQCHCLHMCRLAGWCIPAHSTILHDESACAMPHSQLLLGTSFPAAAGGSRPSLADLVLYAAVAPAACAFPVAQHGHFCNLLRWWVAGMGVEGSSGEAVVVAVHTFLHGSPPLRLSMQAVMHIQHRSKCSHLLLQVRPAAPHRGCAAPLPGSRVRADAVCGAAAAAACRAQGS